MQQRICLAPGEFDLRVVAYPHRRPARTLVAKRNVKLEYLVKPDELRLFQLVFDGHRKASCIPLLPGDYLEVFRGCY